MNSKITAIFCLWLGFGISTANAFEIGAYGNASNYGDGFVVYGALISTQNVPCTDSTSRKVPGEVIKGKCNVEYNGRVYKNSNFLALGYSGFGEPDAGAYYLLELSSETRQYIIEKGITGGGAQAGPEEILY